MSQRHSRCRCGKLLCADLDEARKMHAQIWARRGGEVRVRFYTCPTGFVHWTRKLDPNYHTQPKAAA